MILNLTFLKEMFLLKCVDYPCRNSSLYLRGRTGDGRQFDKILHEPKLSMGNFFEGKFSMGNFLPSKAIAGPQTRGGAVEAMAPSLFAKQ